LGEQVTAVGVVSGGGLPQLPTKNASRSNLEASFTSLLARRAPALFFRQFSRQASSADMAILSNPVHKVALLRHVREAFRHGSRGVVEDAALLAQPWGIAFDAISTPVRLWHGEDDRTVPVASARIVAEAIPGCTPTFIPGAGRLWLLEHAGEVLDILSAKQQ
ncbi:MAG: alpha/beta hydrolase, partial [Anaerolineaceae bacterium]